MAIDRRAAVLALPLLAACSLAPAYRPPQVAVPAAYKEAPPAGWAEAVPADATPRGAWWLAYGDPVLNDLEARADAASPTLAAALARYDAARAQAGIAAAALVPEVDGGATVAHDRVSAHAPGNYLQRSTISNPAVLDASLTYEIDLWGRVRNSVAQARANATASAQDLASARLSLQAAVADSYVQLRGLDAQLDLLRGTVAAYEKAYRLTVTRHNGGIGAGMDVSRAKTTLDNAKAQVWDFTNQRAVVEHELAALTGAVASSFTLAPGRLPAAVPAFAPGVPSALLQRRPDVAAAERRVYAANAGIGVARAALFPTVTLGLGAGWQGRAGDLINAPNGFWSLGPAALSMPFFDGGRRLAGVRLSRAQYDEIAADYRATVLAAFQQVEDGLAGMTNLASDATNQRDAATAAERTRDLAMIRYRDGATDYLEVVTAQTAALGAEQQAITVETNRMRSSILLVKALGGPVGG